MNKRVVLIVLDSLGMGALPDASEFGDEGSHTLKSCFDSGELFIPNLCRMGLGKIPGNEFLPDESHPLAAFGKMAEQSRGKDTTIGHWELAGVVSPTPQPTYPKGFPQDVMEEFSRRIGRGWLCNLPFSGTEVIRLYGEEHMKTGKPIVYTSADSVFQIACHEEVVPLEKLYRMCQIARDLLQGEHAVGRVIARPFVTGKSGFERTANRHDYALEPPTQTLLDRLKDRGRDVISIGKIEDIFAKRGITESHRTKSNEDGIQKSLRRLEEPFEGLMFVNLVEFDSVYGHRNDAKGYARALNAFDQALPRFTERMKEGDLLIITADHGCDPATPSTDHSREYVPLLVYGKGINPVDLGERKSFADVAATVSEYCLGENPFSGRSFLQGLEK